MLKRSLLLPILLIFSLSASAGEVEFDPYYQGSEVIADGEGQVHVKVVFFPNEDCWNISGIREGVPDKLADQPTERHLYVTVNIAKTKSSCALTSAALQAKIVIPDKKGKISTDIFFVDERGVLTRSQRHRIQRDAGSGTCDC